MNEFKSIEKIITSIRIWMRKYDPLVLYKYISILSIHPSNQIFQIRFEFLLAIMTTIRTEEYQNTSLDYEEFCKFIIKFKSETDSFFIEDFTPFSQLKLIPYFFEKEKFVVDNFNLFLDFFQIKDKHNWIFKKGFVVNYNFASAYVKDIDVDFVFYDELDSYFRGS